MPTATQLINSWFKAAFLSSCPQPPSDTLTHGAQGPEAYFPGIGLRVREGWHGSNHSLDSPTLGDCGESQTLSALLTWSLAHRALGTTTLNWLGMAGGVHTQSVFRELMLRKRLTSRLGVGGGWEGVLSIQWVQTGLASTHAFRNGCDRT